MGLAIVAGELVGGSAEPTSIWPASDGVGADDIHWAPDRSRKRACAVAEEGTSSAEVALPVASVAMDPPAMAAAWVCWRHRR
ncbi:MAG: hypothetical protein U1U88_000851 [Lawsonella clevelandensis]